MYNRYIPQESNYTQVERAAGEKNRPTYKHNIPKSGKDPVWQAVRRLVPLGEKGVSGDLIKRLQLNSFDSGDLLVLMILLLLLTDGEDWDPIIALGLFFVLGLADEKKD